MQLEKVKRLIALYEQGLIPTLAQHEVNPGLPRASRENYLYFTLPVCINFQRNSPAMWAAALATWEDPETQYVFSPEKLAETPIEKVRGDLVKHRLALQPNKHTLFGQLLQRRYMITMATTRATSSKKQKVMQVNSLYFYKKLTENSFRTCLVRSFLIIGPLSCHVTLTSSSKTLRRFRSFRILTYCKAALSSALRPQQPHHFRSSWLGRSC